MAPTCQPRLLLIQAYSFPGAEAAPGGKEARLMNYPDVAPFLAGVAWDLHPGPASLDPLAGVETREEFMLIGARRLPIVREACESGRYDAIVLLGGGDPGFLEAREIGHRYGIPVTACAHAQMHVAAMLGEKFSFLDVGELHNVRMRDLVVQYRFSERCASIRNIEFQLPRSAAPAPRPVTGEKEKAERGDHSPMLEAAVAEVEAAIEQDGAEVVGIGCSALYWMQPYLERRLAASGWAVPVLEGYRCAILQAKLLAGLGVDASGLAFPDERPRKWRRRKAC